MAKTLLYDEKKIAKSIFENGFTDGVYNRREGFLVSKYIRHTQNCGDKKLKSLLVEFCSQGEGFSEIGESSYIKKMVRNSTHEFIQRNEIIITQQEIDMAQTVKNFQSQKIYLSMVAFAKKNGSTFVSMRDWTYVKRVAGTKLSTRELYTHFHVLYKENLIYPVIKGGIGGHKILFIDWDNEPEKIKISNDREFYSLGKTYETICGGWLMYCEDCGQMFARSGTAQKYCETHALLREKNRKR